MFISLNENDQRMILVAGIFRKEVTSTVMWMLNYGIKVQSEAELIIDAYRLRIKDIGYYINEKESGVI